MKVINLYGGPGVGKSTLAADLFARFKRDGYVAEYSREAAKDLLYQQRTLADCQMLITALQYQNLKDLERAGTEVVITDGPLLHGMAYATGLPYAHKLRSLLLALAEEFENIDVFIYRNVAFQKHGRVQPKEEAASQLDGVIEQWVRSYSSATETLRYTPMNGEEPSLYAKLKELVQ